MAIEINKLGPELVCMKNSGYKNPTTRDTEIVDLEKTRQGDGDFEYYGIWRRDESSASPSEESYITELKVEGIPDGGKYTFGMAVGDQHRSDVLRLEESQEFLDVDFNPVLDLVLRIVR